MARAEAYRELVVARARGACEYCRLLQAATGVTFHIEHVLPRSQGSETVLGNLALSCPGCNLAKSERTSGTDDSGVSQPLYNPRDYEPSSLGWYIHFALDRDTGIISPRTAVGQATVATLRMNDSLRVFARKLQIQAGLIS
jgi:HNH endonuclease